MNPTANIHKTISCASLLLVWLIAAPPCLSQQQPADQDALQQIRARQQQLSVSGNVRILTRDEGLRSVTRLDGVPDQFTNVTINNENDLIALLDALYPYFGFSGSEALVFQDKRRDGDSAWYTFQETIHGISTSISITVEVPNRSNRILSFYGNVVLDRGFESAHRISEQNAVKKARDYLAQHKKLADTSNGNAVAKLFYWQWGSDGGLAPWWMIRIDKADPCFVSPSGEVDQTSGIITKQ